MKQNQERSKAISLLFEAVGYSAGGLFLLTLTTATISLWVNQIAGWLFIAFSVFLIIASFRNSMIPWGDKGLFCFAYPLFVVTLAGVIIEACDSKQSIIVILASIFVLLLFAGIVFQTVKIFKKR